MQDSAKNPRHVPGMGRPWRQTGRRCHCQFVHQKNSEEREGWQQREGLKGALKKRMKVRSEWCKRWKDGERSKPMERGDRCLEATLETEGVKRRRRRWRSWEMDDRVSCWASVSDSCLGLFFTLRQTEKHRTLLFPHIYFSWWTDCWAILTHRCPPSSNSSFPLSRSLGAIFTSKLLHYLPSLRAIRNGVTLSGRHCHSSTTTHPLSWGPLWGPQTLMERTLGAPTPPPYPSTYPQLGPSFWLVNCGVKRCVIKWQSKQVLWGCVTDLAGGEFGMNENGEKTIVRLWSTEGKNPLWMK